VFPDDSGTSTSCARQAFGKNDAGQQGSPAEQQEYSPAGQRWWFYELQPGKQLKKKDTQGEWQENLADRGAFLPSMLRVDTTGRAGLFDPCYSLGVNAQSMLRCLGEVMHASHREHPAGAEHEMMSQGGFQASWKLPWKVVEQGDQDGELRNEGGWVCDEYSKQRVQSYRKGRPGMRSRFAISSAGKYLQVLMGYSSKNKDSEGGHKSRQAVYEYAHRIVLWAFRGPSFKEGNEVPHGIAMHACDRPTCLCVAHLSWGTSYDNNYHVVKSRRVSGPVRRQLQFDI